MSTLQALVSTKSFIFHLSLNPSLASSPCLACRQHVFYLGSSLRCPADTGNSLSRVFMRYLVGQEVFLFHRGVLGALGATGSWVLRVSDRLLHRKARCTRRQMSDLSAHFNERRRVAAALGQVLPDPSTARPRGISSVETGKRFLQQRGRACTTGTDTECHKPCKLVLAPA